MWCYTWTYPSRKLSPVGYLQLKNRVHLYLLAEASTTSENESAGLYFLSSLSFFNSIVRILTRTSVSQLHHKVLQLFKGCRRYSASQGCQSVTDAVCGRPGGDRGSHVDAFGVEAGGHSALEVAEVSR